jgi:ATP-dependent DNA ligase
MAVARPPSGSGLPAGFSERRALLEEFASGWEPPLPFSPATTDPDEAARWFIDLPHTAIEGLVIKGNDQPYTPGARSWLKLKHRETLEIICGAVIGPITQPQKSSPPRSWTASCGSSAGPHH